ncbi:MAG: hypothetical protein GVY36_15100 [Verrucomicrobia bacterium]|nr:hypothetical protein [Verrucomicrobiota bacterium]
MSLILRILAVIAAIASGALFYVGKGKLAEKEEATKAAQAATVVVQSELDEANEHIATLEGQLAEETRKHSQTKRDLENTRSEMYTASQEVSRTQQQLSQAKKNISELENEARDLRSELVETEQSLADANRAAEELAVLKEQYAELQKSKARPTAPDRELTEPKPKPNTSVSGANEDRQANARVGIETTIRSVSKENGLIVLANNSDLKLASGREVTIVQNSNALGKISVTEITRDLVSANILPGGKTGNLTAGSTVKIYY